MPRWTVIGWPMLTSRSEEHTSELQSLRHLVCRLLLEKKKKKIHIHTTEYPYELPFARLLPAFIRTFSAATNQKPCCVLYFCRCFLFFFFFFLNEPPPPKIYPFPLPAPLPI